MSMRHDIPPDIGSPAADQRFSVLGVRILNVTKRRAIDLVENAIRDHAHPARSVFFVNAHTLNLAAADAQYRAILNRSDFVFADGTGVRWAARLQSVILRDNLVGTDFTPLLLESTAGRGYSYFMLGGDQGTIESAARYAERSFPGWTLCGFHHGFLQGDPEMASAVVEKINAARPDVLLVGMGNPLQEQWIERYQDRLRVPVCMGIGGLFDYWAGNVSRAPGWLRKLGHEWIWRLYQQPRDKLYRYMVGNPLFLMRIVNEHWARRTER
jgi:N-acetylglucosaminyldiphosphoundecaprenol N-acetyl-beta-D-mannosaminyltransferase